MNEAKLKRNEFNLMTFSTNDARLQRYMIFNSLADGRIQIENMGKDA